MSFTSRSFVVFYCYNNKSIQPLIQCIHSSIHPSPSVHALFHPSTQPLIHSSAICSSFHSIIHLSIHSSIHPPIRPPIPPPFIHLSTHPFPPSVCSLIHPLFILPSILHWFSPLLMHEDNYSFSHPFLRHIFSFTSLLAYELDHLSSRSINHWVISMIICWQAFFDIWLCIHSFPHLIN